MNGPAPTNTPIRTLFEPSVPQHASIGPENTGRTPVGRPHNPQDLRDRAIESGLRAARYSETVGPLTGPWAASREVIERKSFLRLEEASHRVDS